MRRAFVPLLMITGAALLSAPATSPAAALTGSHPLSGVFVSDADSSNYVSVTVRQWSEGQYEMHVHGDRRFECVGFLVDSAFAGVVRAVDDAGKVTGGPDYGVLRLQFRADGSVSATLELKDGGPRASTWHRVSALVEDDERVRKPPPLLLDDPPFGQYQYVDALPIATKRIAPVYPGLARAQGVEGTVMLQVLVRKDGTVGHWEVTRSIPALDAAAVDAIARWKFKPARRDGRTVPAWVAVPVTFTLKD